MFGNYHGTNIIVFLANDGCCNVCYMKSKVEKLSFLHVSIATSNNFFELVLSTIEGK
jgi:hypothetical protein